MQVVFGHLYGIAIFHDSISLYKLLGSTVICWGVVAVSWPSKDKGDKYHIISDAMPQQHISTVEARCILAAVPLLKEAELRAEKGIELPVSDSRASKV